MQDFYQNDTAAANNIHANSNADDHIATASSHEKVSEIVRNFGTYRQSIDPQTLGRMAASVLLHQFNVEKAKTTMHWPLTTRAWTQMAYESIYLGGPLALLAAAISLDIAIFGGAAVDLIKVSPYFSAMAFGSIVFAVGAGISQGLSKGAILACMMVASAGTSLIVADNPALISKYANVLPNYLSDTKHAAAGDAASAQSQVTYWQGIIDADTKQLNTGGRGGLPILGDGFTGNDEQGHTLEKQILDAQINLAKANGDAARAGTQQIVAADQSPDKFVGKLMAASVISAFLIASQIAVANFIGKLGQTVGQEDNRETNERVGRFSWKMLERRDAAVEAHSGLILAHFESVLAQAAGNDPAKAENFTNLFVGPSLERMQMTAGSVFRQAVPRSRGLIDMVKVHIFRRKYPPLDGPFQLSGTVSDTHWQLQPAINENIVPPPMPAPRVRAVKPVAPANI